MSTPRALMGVLAMAVVAAMSGPPAAAQAPPPATSTAADVPVYRPPQRGVPGGRVGGGTRGEREVFILSVLAPDHVGLTGREQVTLAWFLSSPTSSPVEVTVTDPRRTRPVLEIRIPPPVPAGVQRVRLAEHGVRLEPGVAYRWFVAVVPDPERRSRDILAGGAIQRVDWPEAVRARVAAAPARQVPFLYAEAGFWYDALEALAELIEAAPGDAALRRQRAALLEQVGLVEVARRDVAPPR